MSTSSSPLPNWGEGKPATSAGRGEGNIDATLKFLTIDLENFSDAPNLDAQRIILHAINQRDASYFIAHSDDPLTEKQISEITRMQDLRKTSMPLAYILGEADFYGRTFIVTPDVLIPRPDTELLIEKALEYIRVRHARPDRASTHLDSGSLPGITIADIGTGSGCIAITLALELYNLPATTYRLIATDISEAALAIAKQNAEKHDVLDKIEFLQGNMLEPFASSPPYQGGVGGGGARRIDLIVSNPPYIPTEELATISARHPRPVRGSTSADDAWIPALAGMTEKAGLLFEPRMALDGGIDGQLFVNQIKASGIPAIIETIGGEIIEI